MILDIKLLSNTAKAPRKNYNSDAGFDLFSDEEVVLLAGAVTKVKTKVSMSIPDGYCGIIKDRSSLGSGGIHVFAGVIDSAYRGEIIICLFNSRISEYRVLAGDKIAQMLIVPVPNVNINVVESLETSDRGDNGFGSSGR